MYDSKTIAYNISEGYFDVLKDKREENPIKLFDLKREDIIGVEYVKFTQNDYQVTGNNIFHRMVNIDSALWDDMEYAARQALLNYLISEGYQKYLFHYNSLKETPLTRALYSQDINFLTVVLEAKLNKDSHKFLVEDFFPKLMAYTKIESTLKMSLIEKLLNQVGMLDIIMLDEKAQKNVLNMILSMPASTQKENIISRFNLRNHKEELSKMISFDQQSELLSCLTKASLKIDTQAKVEQCQLLEKALEYLQNLPTSTRVTEAALSFFSTYHTPLSIQKKAITKLIQYEKRENLDQLSFTSDEIRALRGESLSLWMDNYCKILGTSKDSFIQALSALGVNKTLRADEYQNALL
jgi:hypothetical protein